MPKDRLNGVELLWDVAGSTGPVITLIHGAWVDHGHWNGLVPHLKDRFRVLTYDRRGHSQSERPAGQGTMRDDVEDLAALLAFLDLAPAHLVGNSYGAMIAIRMAADHPDACLSVSAHEPPFLHLNERVMANHDVQRIDRLQRDVAEQWKSGNAEPSIAAFMNAVVRPNAWDSMPAEFRAFLVSQAPSFVDDVNDPHPWSVELQRVARFPRPILLTGGEHSPPFYDVVLNEIFWAVPRARKRLLPGVDHDPHVSSPKDYAETIASFIDAAA